jgi:hypothetical protein
VDLFVVRVVDAFVDALRAEAPRVETWARAGVLMAMAAMHTVIKV